MSDSDPYVEARREWNDRYLELVRERRLCQVVASAELVVLMVAITSLVSLNLQRTTAPYVVEVDPAAPRWCSSRRSRCTLRQRAKTRR